MIGNPLAVDALIDALDDPSTSVCESAIDALGKIGDSRAIEPLKALLHDSELRDAARAALKNLGYQAQASEPHDLNTQWGTHEVVRERKLRDLIEMLQDNNPAERARAAEALGKHTANWATDRGEKSQQKKAEMEKLKQSASSGDKCNGWRCDNQFPNCYDGHAQ